MAQVAGFKATSDIPAWLTQPEETALRGFLESRPEVHRKGRASYMLDERLVDFSSYIGMPPQPGALTNFIGAIVGALADIKVIMRVFDAINRRLLKSKLKKNPI